MAKKAESAKARNGALPQIAFKGDFQMDVTGEIQSGSEVTILFDAERLPFERSLDEKGKAAWTISAFYQFASGGEIKRVELQPEKAPRKKTKDAAAETFLKGVLSVPAGSREAIIWFLNTGKTGIKYYDSDFGKNYRFPVVPVIIETEKGKKPRAKRTAS